DLRNKPVFDNNGVHVGEIILTQQDKKTKLVSTAQLQINPNLKIKYPDINRNVISLDLNIVTVDPTTKKVSLAKTVMEIT
ncbi:MAG: PRC-barrel domain-containing protein, partial [Thermoplasmata archaeon]|nr:PRC-barrel domain-containing protein [Thermoplasmata archaeon]